MNKNSQHFRLITGLLILSIVSALFFTGCAARQKPKVAPTPPSIKIPEKISRGENQEPELKVYVVKDKKVKQMKLEDYVTGVVAGEVENTWELETLAAQAILARTYVLEFVKDKGGSKYQGADISTDFEEAQAWNPDNINDNIKKAVEATRGMVVTYNGDFIKAWFHSHSGGMTATAKEGLNYKEEEPPYIQVVKSGDENVGPEGKKSWRYEFSKEEVRRLIKEKLGQDTGDIKEVAVLEKGPSGRAVKIKIGNAEVHGADLRMALDPMKMRSNLITSLKIEKDKIVMEGKGFGHGVGMSQWGANEMAKQGKKAEEIIKYYFKGVKIVKLWN
ncbi:SpoIID/LytB domain-containing protein [Thermovenabulum sp.]|uniref:SpoIID/LytB domain-containing protein n=1 Tax=Thermovenabulum sp. TaxID=3100335 RepID=UPI003C7A2BD8